MNFKRVSACICASVATLVILGATPAYAQLTGTDTAPGSSCAGFENGTTRLTADSDLNGEGVVLVCDGSIWNKAEGSTPLWQEGAGTDIYYNSGTTEVGIGTSNPTYTLDVNGTIRAANGIMLDPVSGGSPTYMDLDNLDSVNLSSPTDGDVLSYSSGEWINSAGGGGSSFWEVGGTTNSIHYSSGNLRVGIGESNPAAVLDIYSGNFSSATTGINNWYWGSAPDNTTSVEGIVNYANISAPSGGSANHAGFNNQVISNVGGGTTPYLAGIKNFTSNQGSTTYTNLYGITTFNGTGIGDITNSYGVYIGNDTAAFGSITNTYALYIEDQTDSDTSNYAIYTNAGLVRLNDDVGIGKDPIVALDVVGDINYTGVLVDVSDIRMKYDIQPLQSPLQKLTTLNGFSFKMKGDEKQSVEYGVSAQDVQEVFPELVHQVDTDGTMGVSYNGLIAPMIEAIKEQQKQIDTLQKEVESLKAQLDSKPEEL